MIEQARASVYWPNIDEDIRRLAEQCEDSRKNAPSYPKKPLLPTPPEFTMQHVVADIFSHGREYLAYACHLTGWVEIAFFDTTPSTILEKTLKEFFHRWGIPEELDVDGASYLKSTSFLAFLKRWGVSIRLSSAYYPQSNGWAEIADKTV